MGCHIKAVLMELHRLQINGKGGKFCEHAECVVRIAGGKVQENMCDRMVESDAFLLSRVCFSWQLSCNASRCVCDLDSSELTARSS